MDRPYVICHMCVSIDGKISGSFMDTPQAAPALKAYSELRSFFDCKATLYGTTTMLGGYAEGTAMVNEEAALCNTPYEDFISEGVKEAGQLIIAMDPEGKLAYQSSIIEKKGRAPAVVVEILTEQASAAYLHYLRQLGVSYLFCGKETIDVVLLLQKLKEKLGVMRLMLAGGGVTNWHFLKAGMIDELSLVVAPVIDGQAHGLSIVEGESNKERGDFSLSEVQKLEGGALWLRYTWTAQK